MKLKQRWIILSIVSIALLLIFLDVTVLYVALPKLTNALEANASEKLWILNIYSLVVAALLPGAGTLSDRFGHKKLFIYGLVIFGIASFIAAYSVSAEMLIAARVLLAIGATAMMPATLSLIRVHFKDEDERSLAFGVWASIASGGAVLGPVVGGVLLEHFWWGSVFLINVPIVIIALFFTIFCIPADEEPSDKKPWDLIGSVQIMIGLLGVTYAIKVLSKREMLLAEFFIALLIGVIFIGIFIHRQKRREHPLIDFSLFTNPVFSAGVVTALVCTMVLIGFELVLSQRLQLVLGLSPLQAGLFILPISLAALIAGPITGIIMARLGPQKLIIPTLMIAALGICSYIFIYEKTPTVQLISLCLVGFGLSAATTAASSSVMNNAPVERAGMTASIEEVAYELGGTLGVAIMGSVMNAVYTKHFILPNELGLDQSVRDGIDEVFRVVPDLATDKAESLLQLAFSAFNSSFLAVLQVSSALLIGLIIVVFLIKKKWQ